MVVVLERWIATGDENCIINVYAPCKREEKVMLRDRLSLVAGQWEGIHVCIIGDFNSILEEGERV